MLNFNATDNRVLELYSYAYSSGEQNAAISHIIVHLTYIRGLIHGIGRGVPNAPIQTQAATVWRFSMICHALTIFENNMMHSIEFDFMLKYYLYATTQNDLCAQRRLRSAWANYVKIKCH